MRRLCVVALALCVAVCLAAESTRIECSNTGCKLNRQVASSPAMASKSTGSITASGSGSILWKATQPILIYDTVAITANGSIAAFTLGSNAALHDTLEVADAATGKKHWSTTNGTDFGVTRDPMGTGSVIPVMDRIPCCPVPTTAMFSNAQQYSIASATPIVNITLRKSIQVAGFTGVAQSSTGNTFAYGSTSVPHFPSLREYYASVVIMVNGERAESLAFGNATTLDAVMLSADGTIVVVLFATGKGEAVYAYDMTRREYVLNSTTENFFSSASLCVSPDASYIAVGFQTLDVWRRNPSTGNYAQIVNNGPLPIPNVFFSVCAVSNTGDLGIAFFDSNYLQTSAAMVTVGHGATPKTVWTWVSPVENGTDQDLPAAAAMDSAGKVFTFCSWGTGVGMTPTVRVFSVAKAAQQQVFNITTPGSMFDVDLLGAPNSPGTYLVLAAGKHVHANVMGDGGDIVMGRFQL